MTQLSSTCLQILKQLDDVVAEISSQDFTRPALALSGSTVGQHVRHTLEFFICLELGFECGVINYDNRGHSKTIETDKAIALLVLKRVRDFVVSRKEDGPLNLEVCYNSSLDGNCILATSYHRELAYNIEHCVHHLAIMKIALREVAPYLVLPEDFGVAISTVRHQKSVLNCEKD